MNDDAPLKKDPPPMKDPEIRKGPLKDPPAGAPAEIDPPVEPHVPGDPKREISAWRDGYARAPGAGTRHRTRETR
jgi:hypothetical protein